MIRPLCRSRGDESLQRQGLVRRLLPAARRYVLGRAAVASRVRADVMAAAVVDVGRVSLAVASRDEVTPFRGRVASLPGGVEVITGTVLVVIASAAALAASAAAASAATASAAAAVAAHISHSLPSMMLTSSP